MTDTHSHTPHPRTPSHDHDHDHGHDHGHGHPTHAHHWSWREPKSQILLGILVLILVWLIVPSSQVAVTGACKPAGFRANLSATLTGSWFWNRQLTAVLEERDRLLAIQNRGDADDDVGAVSPIEQRMERLNHRKGGASEMSDLQRDEIIKARQAARIKRLAELMQCADRIDRRGSGY